MTATHVMHVELGSEGAACELWLNDIPVTRAPGGRSWLRSIPAEHLLVPGLNSLSLVLDPGLPASRSVDPRRSWSRPTTPVVARLARYRVNTFVGDPGAEVVASIVAETPIDPVGVQRVQFALPAGLPTWAWQRAPRLTMNRSLEVEALEVAGAIRQALLEGAPHAILERISTRMEEFTRAVDGRSLDKTRESFVTWVRQNPDRPTWDMEPIDPARVDLRLCADGRLVECLDLDGEPLVRSTPQSRGVVIPYPLLLGRHEGRLVALR